jgi:glycosyltransferase involved in cell wall biosynthesis
VGILTYSELGVWFPTPRTGTGSDVFTETLVEGLHARGVRAQITWLPLRAEYAPWSVPLPDTPRWANVAHVNTWLHPRFLPADLPVVATLHHAIHQPSLDARKGLLRAFYHRYWIRTMERATMTRADAVVAVSRYAAESARKNIVDRPMLVVPNGVDTAQFHPAARKVQSTFRLLYVGGWKKLKGVHMLPAIMSELGDGFELFYTGGRAVAASEKAGFPDNMHDLGRLAGRDAVVDAMRSADALLFPSLSEGFGLVAAEAMACGLPVIASGGSSLDEVVDDGETGFLCPPGDIRAFAEAARRLARNREWLDAMADHARQKASTCFSLQAVVSAYLEIYQTLADK